ncbi:DUF1289 domain-containing protein [Turneriella parva]|uniref:Fe-S protein n=1 Tax=Turneriella parva (strain ATCC BAA-1111 / DSM 21527 / NCTC 11395 / H) TaxID=869212 RepID=I4BBW4_TURPD|nr:DUF1289 domain-containing protein [Turneriella parva]AFM14771.1 protein of unknown function DUF1289 [Turneriella parva DSM 21527]
MVARIKAFFSRARDHLIESPCIAVCKLDDAGRICIGCYRTVDEITTWPQLDRQGKYAVIENARRRRSSP